MQLEIWDWYPGSSWVKPSQMSMGMFLRQMLLKIKIKNKKNLQHQQINQQANKMPGIEEKDLKTDLKKKINCKFALWFFHPKKRMSFILPVCSSPDFSKIVLKYILNSTEVKSAEKRKQCLGSELSWVFALGKIVSWMDVLALHLLVCWVSEMWWVRMTFLGS